MAAIYEQYLKNKSVADGKPDMTTLVDAAMDQTELLQGVLRRVENYVEMYEQLGLPQQIKCFTVHSGEISAELTLDDLKILVDKFPQRDF